MAVPVLFSAACAKCSVGVTTSITHSRAAVDSSTSWPVLPDQLRLIGLQVAEQDSGLSLADVQAGQLPQPLGVKAPITNGDMDSELARILG